MVVIELFIQFNGGVSNGVLLLHDINGQSDVSL
jgi:hypothetical protein